MGGRPVQTSLAAAVGSDFGDGAPGSAAAGEVWLLSPTVSAVVSLVPALPPAWLAGVACPGEKGSASTTTVIAAKAAAVRAAIGHSVSRRLTPPWAEAIVGSPSAA